MNPSAVTLHERPLPWWVRAADVLTLALLALTLWAVLFGGIRFSIGGLPVSITGAWRLLLETVAIVAIRHALYRRPTILDRIRAGTARVPDVGPTMATVAPVFLTTRLMVLLVGFVAVVTFGYPPSATRLQYSASEFENLPARWDTGWYVGIAMSGYRPDPRGRADRQQNLNFFPAFPMLMRAASGLLAPAVHAPAARFAWAGVLVALVSFFWALIYLYRSTRDRFGHDTAAAALTFLATYPFALFFSAAYSEGVFLLGAIAALVHARRGQFATAGLCGLLVGLVRPNGCLLAVPLAAVALLGARETAPTMKSSLASLLSRRGVFALAMAAMPVVGMLLYSFYVYQLTGRPFFWAELQREAWGRWSHGPYESLFIHFEEINKLGLLAYLAEWPYDAFHLLAALFAIATIWPVARRIGVPEGLFVAINVLVPLFNGSLISMGRFTSVLFPSFVWLALAVPPQYRTLVAALFAMGQAIAAALFFTWRGVF